jgi:catechol 2,3-dioxygenase-like lactoylglutathione lyase family enzyme
MYKIRHIAIRADDQKKVAEFYKSTFGMRRCATWRRRPFICPTAITLAILQQRRALGIDHFGFQVDDPTRSAAAASRRLGQTGRAPRDGRFAEFRVHDPVGSPIDLSEAGWKSS